MKMILLGAPGAGKGTQAEILSKSMNIPSISTGNILREAMKNGTPVGAVAKVYVEAGKLVPDEVIIGIVRERLEAPDCANGFILDGVPRTIPQAEAIDGSGIVFDAALCLEVSDEEIIARMSGRRTCSGCSAVYHIKNNPPREDGVCDVCGEGLSIRHDDEPETVKVRLDAYHRETEPLKGFYNGKGILHTVISRPTIAETTAVIKEALGI